MAQKDRGAKLYCGGGAIERYREGKREREEITASNRHMRDVFVPGDLQTSYFFMTTFV